MRNTPIWLLIFWVVPYNKMCLFSKDVITFTISFISLFVSISAEDVIQKSPFLFFLPLILTPVSTRRLSIPLF